MLLLSQFREGSAKPEAMKTKKQLQTLTEKAGGILEEDAGGRDWRVFQAVAPRGKLWAGSDLKCLRIEWPAGYSTRVADAREDAFKDAAERVSHGLRDMTTEEREEYEEREE